MAAGMGLPTQQANPSRGLAPPRNRKSRENARSRLNDVRRRLAPVLDFWTKINNDWIFNWASGLAYTLLTSILPILLAILAIGGFILGSLSVSSLGQLQSVLARGLPGGSTGAGGQIVSAALAQLNRSAGVLFIVGILGAIIAGSGLFLSLESAFGIIFRLKGRDPIPQRIMAISMVLLYVLLVPIMVFASLIPAAILGALHVGTKDPGGAFLLQALGLAVGFAAAVVFFGSIFYVVPNRRMSLREIWPGTLVSAVLLVVYEIVFPIYENLFLRSNYSSIIGLIVVILIFFYYLAFILLIGAEINSMLLGLRPTTKSLSAMLESLQEHDLMIEPSTTASAATLTSTVSRPAPDISYLPARSPAPVKSRRTATTSQQATMTAIVLAGTIALIGALQLGGCTACPRRAMHRS